MARFLAHTAGDYARENRDKIVAELKRLLRKQLGPGELDSEGEPVDLTSEASTDDDLEAPGLGPSA